MKSGHYIIGLIMILMITTANAECEDVIDQLINCENRTEICRAELRECTDDLDLTRANLTFYTALYNDCKDQLNKSEIRISTLESNNSDLRKEIEAVRSQLQSIEKDKKDLSDLVKNLRDEKTQLGETLEQNHAQLVQMDMDLENQSLVIRDLDADIEEYQNKFDYGCADPLSAYADFYDKWRKLNMRGRDCLPKIMVLKTINPSQIPGVCDIPLRETELGYEVPSEVHRIWSDYLRLGFIALDEDQQIYRPVNFGTGCLSFFEDRLQRDNQLFQETLFWILVINTMLWIAFLFFRGKWRDYKRRVTGKDKR